jgi:hypothetical protein
MIEPQDHCLTIDGRMASSAPLTHFRVAHAAGLMTGATSLRRELRASPSLPRLRERVVRTAWHRCAEVTELPAR